MKILKSISLFLMFTLIATKIYAQEITVFPGFWSSEYYQDDKEIDKKELEVLFAKNAEVQVYWKKAQGQQLAGTIAIAAEMGFVVWWTLELINNDPSLTERDKVKNGIGPALGVIGTGIVGSILIYSSSKSKKKAILTYNKQFDKKTVFHLVPVSDQNGLGLALKF